MLVLVRAAVAASCLLRQLQSVCLLRGASVSCSDEKKQVCIICVSIYLKSIVKYQHSVKRQFFQCVYIMIYFSVYVLFIFYRACFKTWPWKEPFWPAARVGLWCSNDAAGPSWCSTIHRGSTAIPYLPLTSAATCTPHLQEHASFRDQRQLSPVQ